MSISTFATKLNNIKILYWLLVVGFVLFALVTAVWINIVHLNPRNVFNGMVSNNLAVTGYTREVNSDQQGMSSNEIGQIQTGGVNSIQTITTLERGDENVVTQSIGLDGAEFVKYNKISTSQKTSSGSNFDFSKVEGVWSKNDSAGMSSSFQQLLLGIVPMGNTSPEVRAKIKKFMKEHTVYATDFNTVKKEKRDGRQVYTYDIQIMPQTYIEMLKLYAPSVGLAEQVKELNPQDYAEAEPTSLTISIDAISRNLVEVKYPDSKRTEKYSGYGITKAIQTPSKTITSQELQKRISEQN